jgi:hypothetical protein
MVPYQTKSSKLPGTSYKEVYKHAQNVFKQIKRRTKRKSHVRSAYFNKQKVFFDNFWIHLYQKPRPERMRRLKYFECAIELMLKSRNHPDSMENTTKKSELLHRFKGISKEGEIFYVQIKEHKPTGTKQLMSIFPEK